MSNKRTFEEGSIRSASTTIQGIQERFSQLPSLNPTSKHDKMYLSDKEIEHPAKKPRIPTPSLSKVTATQSEAFAPENKSLSFLHAAACGFNFRPYEDYLPSWRFPKISVDDLIMKAKKKREEDYVSVLNSEASLIIPPVFESAVSLPVPREAPIQDKSLRVITVCNVSKFMFEVALRFFRGFGSVSTYEYDGSEPRCLHILYQTEAAADAALSAQIPNHLQRFGIYVVKTDLKTSQRLLGIPESPSHNIFPDITTSQLSKSIVEPLEVLKELPNYFVS